MNEEIKALVSNKKLLSAIDSDNKSLALQIASKLYSKARGLDIVQEIVLGCVIDWAKEIDFDAESAIEKIKDYMSRVDYFKRRSIVEASEKYQTETDPLKRFDMKESA